MSGIINNNPAPPPANSTAPMSNPMLREAEERLEAGIAPDNRENYTRVVVAGMAAALARGPNGILARLLKNPDPVKGAARGAVALVLILRRETKQTPMPIKAMVPAGLTLMFRALDFVDRAGKVKIGAPELDRAAHIFTNDMFAAFNITPPMLARAAARVHAITQDPRAMQAINLKAGIVPHPLATKAPV